MHAALDDDLDGASEHIYLANKEDIVKCRLTPEQRRHFIAAKDDALQPWIDNAAWEPVAAEEARSGESCPLRFLLKWKVKDGEQMANARVNFQVERGDDQEVGDRESHVEQMSTKHGHC